MTFEAVLFGFRAVWFCGAFAGLLVAFWRLHDSMGDLQAVRLRRIANGRRGLALAGLAYDVAFILMFAGQSLAAISLLLDQGSPIPPAAMLTTMVRTVLALGGVWAVLLAAICGLVVRRAVNRALGEARAK